MRLKPAGQGGSRAGKSFSSSSAASGPSGFTTSDRELPLGLLLPLQTWLQAHTGNRFCGLWKRWDEGGGLPCSFLAYELCSLAGTRSEHAGAAVQLTAPFDLIFSGCGCAQVRPETCCPWGCVTARELVLSHLRLDRGQ